MNNKIVKFCFVALALFSITMFLGCRENATGPSEPQGDAIMSSPQYVGQDGFLMPNGKQHKLDCPCNICNAIRVNIDSPCISDTVFTADSGIAIVDTVITFDSTLLIDTLFVTDTIIEIDSVFSFDTVMIIDTVESAVALEGEWLKFSGYEASKAFVLENYPERADDRFSSFGTFCDYTADTPAGQAGFKFVDNGDGTYSSAGYMFKHLFGSDGYVWFGQSSEITFYYSCNMQLESDGSWTLLNVNLASNGTYVRDTRHD